MKKLKKLIVFLLILAAAFFALKMGYKALVEEYFPLKYEDIIEKYAKEYSLSEHLVMGVICAESGFRHDAHSGVASGLMQITDETAQWISGKMGIEYSVDMTKNPETNIKMGCFYLDYLIGLYGNLDNALAAYNAGPGNVNAWLENEEYSKDGKTLKKIPFAETEKYIKRVKIFGKVYEKLYK